MTYNETDRRNGQAARTAEAACREGKAAPGPEEPAVRIGLVGTGRIARRFVPEAGCVQGVRCASVFNPNRESGARFAENFGLACFDREYGEFLDSVDAVYIASVHETHYGYAREAMLRGKHVLCEKPLAFTRREAEELYELAGERRVVLMEALKTAYCPGFQKLCEVVAGGAVGQVRDVEACFTRLTSEFVRERSDAAYGGGFTEFGSHTMLPILKFMGLDYREISYHSVWDAKGVDLYTKVNLVYENGMAASKSGVGVKSEGQLVVAGTKGYLLAPSPWWLTRYFEVRHEDPGQVERYEAPFEGQGLRYEIRDFAAQIAAPDAAKLKFTPEESIALAGIMEGFMRTRRKGRKQEEKG